MSFSVYRGEKRISEISTRLFGRLKAADSKRVAAALLAANPELADLNLVDRGRPIVVPAIEGLRHKDEADVSAPGSELLETARTELEAYATQLDEAGTAERRDLRSQRKLIESDELRAILDANPAGLESLEGVARATERREERSERDKALLRALRKADAELAELRRSFG